MQMIKFTHDNSINGSQLGKKSLLPSNVPTKKYAKKMIADATNHISHIVCLDSSDCVVDFFIVLD